MGLFNWKRDEEQPEQNKGLFAKLKSAVQSTRANLAGKIDTLLRRRKQFDAQTVEELEEILIGADIGVKTTLELLDHIKNELAALHKDDPTTIMDLIRQQLLSILQQSKERAPMKAPDGQPFVVFVVGVNGVGKTTTIGKLAWRLKSDNKSVLICAADTYRAAAGDQLAIWAERAGIPIIQQRPGTDPSAVIYDALGAARARQAEVIIVDTAGRLHNKVQLMRELEKMSRVAGKEIPGAPHEVLLVVDAVTGENGLEQARQFSKTMPITGLVLTKLDGTAKGGIVIAISRELGVPIRFVGVGEGIDDLVEFSPDRFMESLFDTSESVETPVTI